MADHLKYEAGRLRTFVTWPKENIVSKSDLAHDGFYYTGVADKVKCAFCKNELAKWERGDIPREQHKRWYPDCRFLRELDVGNVSLSQGNGRFSSSQFMAQLKQRDERLLSVTSMVRTDFAQLEKRKASFQSWKGNHQASEMALAGLYYIGAGDQVFCYACGQGLSHWNPGENPFVEHARWKPTCRHVLAVKGVDFVECVDLHYRFIERGAVQSAGELTKVLLEAEMVSADVKMLREVGIDVADIQAALQLKISQTGCAFEDPLSLLLAVQMQQVSMALAAGRTASAASTAPSSSGGGHESSAGQQSAAGGTVRKTDSPTSGTPRDAEALARENAQLREMRVCKVCMENDINILLKPCHHACICSECRRHVTQCPVCRSTIKSTETVYLS